MVLDVMKADRGSCGHVLSSGELPQTDMSLCQELLHWSPASMECLIAREVCRFSAKAVLTSSSYHEMLSYTLPEIGQRLEIISSQISHGKDMHACRCNCTT